MSSSHKFMIENRKVSKQGQNRVLNYSQRQDYTI